MFPANWTWQNRWNAAVEDFVERWTIPGPCRTSRADAMEIVAAILRRVEGEDCVST